MERRSFFKLVGVSALLAAGGASVGCTPGQGISSLLSPAEDMSIYSVSNDPVVNFTSDVDVLIVGSGIAGLSAAMAPAEAGKSVMIVDKLDLLGGESFNACGVMRVSGSALQKAAGITTTATEAWDARKQEVADAGISDMDFAKRLVVTAPEWVDHIISTYGAQFADPKSFVNEGAPSTILLPKNGLGDMASIMTPLRDGLANKGVTFSAGLRAIAFILDENSAVCGMRMRAEKNAAISDIQAKHIVVASGGFASSQSLIHANVPAQEHIGCYTYASVGEGLLLCSGISGQLAGMNKAGPLIGDIPQACAWGLFGPTIILNPYGKRFAREDDMNAAANICQSKGVGFWWTVFDKQLTESSQSRSIAETTSKNAKRLVGPFASIEELAAALFIPAEALKETFETYDKAVDVNKDAEFGRTVCLKKLTGPYYALKQFPVRYKTLGGTKTDGEGRLLNATGSPVANVYCCGSTGANSAEGLASNGAFGMLVGQAVVK